MTHATPGNYHTFFINSVIKQLLPWVVSLGPRIFFLSSTQPLKNGKERCFNCCKLCTMKTKQTLNYCCFKIFLVVRELVYYLT